ncbi:MAG TPA: protein translocase subunit SecF [Acidobacteriota bacterium]|nr:protein translocase subunit SecF [Acidobacteriota bacterium]
MDIFVNTNVDFLKYKIPAFILSFVIIIGGFVSIYLKHGLKYGVDFSGGTAIHVKFRSAQPLEAIRKALAAGGFPDSGVQGFTEPTEALVRLPQKVSSGEEVTQISNKVMDLMRNGVLKEPAPAGKMDLTATPVSQVTEYLMLKDPLGVKSSERYTAEVGKLTDLKNANQGLLPSFDQMKNIDPKVLASLKDGYYVSDVVSLSTEYVGPLVGADLREKATLAVIWSLVGMLVYIWIRFEFTWSFAVIICLMHDVLVTLAFVSFFDREISLNVIAAFLTIVGYSVNDTVVVYDRVRDNLKSMRTQPLENVFNASINQTLSRTVLTSGTVFLVTIVLYLFGGAVINDFAFCMLVGVISGTYSTIYQASAMIVVYEKTFVKKKPQPLKAKVGNQKVS